MGQPQAVTWAQPVAAMAGATSPIPCAQFSPQPLLSILGSATLVAGVLHPALHATFGESLLTRCKTHSIFPHRGRETDRASPPLFTSPTFSLVSPYTPITERPRLTSSVSDLEQTIPQGETVQPGSNISRHKGPIPSQ